MALLNNMLVPTCILQQHEFQSFNLAGITKKGLQDSKYLWPIFMSGYFCLKDWYASVCLFQYIFLMMDIFFWTNMFFCHIPFFPSRTTDSRAVPEVVGYSSYFFWSCILSGFSLQSCPGCCSRSGTLSMLKTLSDSPSIYPKFWCNVLFVILHLRHFLHKASIFQCSKQYLTLEMASLMSCRIDLAAVDSCFWLSSLTMVEVIRCLVLGLEINMLIILAFFAGVFGRDSLVLSRARLKLWRLVKSDSDSLEVMDGSAFCCLFFKRFLLTRSI